MSGAWGQWSPAGALLGLVLALGLALCWLGLPARRRPSLIARLEPYLRDAPPPSRLLSTQANLRGSALAQLAAPVVQRLAAMVERVLGGATSVRKRLQRAGERPDLEAFRAEQVVWGVLGGLAGLLLGSLAWLRGNGSLVLPLLLVASGLIGGVVLRDQALTHAARCREERILAEFPTVAELLALSVSAGEGTVAALERVCRLSTGELARELRTCLIDARAGANLQAALQGLADRTGLVSLVRFVDGVVIALERGTPLAEVLRAQAQDVREEGRRAVMESAGRKEIAMMVPVVFLILPVTVLFALYPGFAFLSFSI